MKGVVFFMSAYYIGVDLGGTNLKVAMFDKTLSNIAEVRVPTERSLGSLHVLQRIASTVNQLISEQQLTTDSICCMGMGVPGLLDIEKGISLFSPNFPKWENVEVVHYMEETLHIPTFIDNDVRTNLYGEWHYGAGKNKQNIVLLTLGTGLGSGIVMDGHVLYGATASAGEIGHMNMYRKGRPCRCGSSGCLGRYVSALGMLCTAKEKLAVQKNSILLEWVQNDVEQITAKMVSEAFDLGDSAAIETLQETGELLGYGLVNAINLYNPEIILIGGGMAAAGERLLGSTRKIVQNHALKLSQEACTITLAELGDSAGMIGAAFYAKQKFQKTLNG